MDLIGKIDRPRIFRKRAHGSVWCEDVNLFCQDVFFYIFYEFLGIAWLVLEFHHLLDPVHPNSRFLTVNLTLDPLLIGPVSRNPVLSDFMHFLGSDLEFNRSFRAIYSRMDRLIAIGLPVGNIVLKTPRHWLPEFMDVTQHGIDITWGIQDTADGNQVIDFIETFLFILHLAIDRVDVLWATINFSMQMAFPCIGLNLVDDFFD